MLKAESASQIPLWIEVLKYLHEVFFSFVHFTVGNKEQHRQNRDKNTKCVNKNGFACVCVAPSNILNPNKFD